MKKKFKSIMTAMLFVVVLMSLAGCGSSSKVKPGKPISFSDMLEDGGRRIWYDLAKEQNTIGKDTRILRTLVVENGQIKTYVPKKDGEAGTLGEVAKLTDDEIISALENDDVKREEEFSEEFLKLQEESWTVGKMAEYLRSQQSKAENIKAKKEYYNNFINFMYYECEKLSENLRDDVDDFYNLIYTKKEEDAAVIDKAYIALVDNWEKEVEAAGIVLDPDVVLETYKSSVEPLVRQFHPYALDVETDTTGNSTKIENLNITYEGEFTPPVEYEVSVKNLPGYDNWVEAVYFKSIEKMDTPDEMVEHKIIMADMYGESPVYEVYYCGFIKNNGGYFVTKMEESLVVGSPKEGMTMPKLDQPGTPGVTVD